VCASTTRAHMKRFQSCNMRNTWDEPHALHMLVTCVLFARTTASAVRIKKVRKKPCSQPRRCSQTEAVPHDSDTLFATTSLVHTHTHGNVEGATYANREMLRTTTRTPRLSMATPAPRSTDIPSSLPWSSAANAVSLSSTAAVVTGSADEVTDCVGGAHPPQLRVHLTCSSRCWPIVKPSCTTDASSHPI
jgi:hypothetical protein